MSVGSEVVSTIFSYIPTEIIPWFVLLFIVIIFIIIVLLMLRRKGPVEEFEISLEGLKVKFAEKGNIYLDGIIHLPKSNPIRKNFEKVWKVSSEKNIKLHWCS